MAVVLVAVEWNLEEGIVRELAAHGHRIAARVASGDELLSALEREPHTDAVIVSAAPGYLSAAVLRACDAAGVRAVGIAEEEQHRDRARRLGLLDLVEPGAPWEVLENALFGIATVAAALHEAAAGEGRVIAVWGPAGAPGSTTLAIHLAAALAERHRDVVLCDADVYGASIAPALAILDEAPGFAAAARLAGNEALTEDELDRLAALHRSSTGSFRVLTGLPGPSRWPELTPERVRRTLSACARWKELVVVDTGFSLERDEEISSDLFAPRRNGATHAVLERADRIIAVGSPDPVGLPRFLRAHAELRENYPDTPVSIVVNRVRSSVVGASPAAQIRSTLRRFAGIDRVHVIPEDHRALDTALVDGRTVGDVAPRSPFLRGVNALVDAELMPERSGRRETGEPEGPGRRRRAGQRRRRAAPGRRGAA